MVTSSQAQFFDSLISVLSSPSSHNPLISLTHLPYPSPISHRYFASQLPSHGLAQLPSHGLIASLHLVLSLFFFFFFWVQFVSIMWVCVCVYNFCVYVCIRICVCVCDFERENHKSEICVWFVTLKGKIINLKFVFVICVCVRICVCVCDFGSENDKSEICVSNFGLGMMGQGPRGLDRAGLGWKKNFFIK